MARNLKTYQKINDVVVPYLLENVGEMAVEGAPRFDSEKQQWVVPVSCRTARGVLPAGEIHLNRRLEVIYATTRDEMVRVIEAQLHLLPFIVLGQEQELTAKGLQPLHV